MKLYLSIDLESWAYPDAPYFRDMDSCRRKEIDDGFMPRSINALLDLLAGYNQVTTFFAITETFEWYPKAFEAIRDAGHELAYHSHRHNRIENAGFLEKDLENSREFLKEFKPVGFRAPMIDAPKEAIKALAGKGFKYSSSIYGNHADEVENSGLAEFPVSTYLYKGRRPRRLSYPRPMRLGMLRDEIPFGTGYFLAMLSLRAIDRFIKSYFDAKKPVFMFLHNWQITQPKNTGPQYFRYMLKNPLNLPYLLPMEARLEHFLKNYKFGRMDELL